MMFWSVRELTAINSTPLQLKADNQTGTSRINKELLSNTHSYWNTDTGTREA